MQPSFELRRQEAKDRMTDHKSLNALFDMKLSYIIKPHQASEFITIFYYMTPSYLEKIPLGLKVMSYIVQELMKMEGLNRIKLLGALHRLCLATIEAKQGLQNYFSDFLHLAIQNRYYHLCDKVISHPVVIIDEISKTKLMSFLYYSSIVLTVQQRYKEASEKLSMLLKMERYKTNLMDDALKKYLLVSWLAGHEDSKREDQSKFLSLSQKSKVYAQIMEHKGVKELVFKEVQLKELESDGNVGLAKKLEYMFTIDQLRMICDTNVRIQAGAIVGKQLKNVQNIKTINAIQRIYRYDPMNDCVVFTNAEDDIEETITRVVNLYMEIRESAVKQKKSYGKMSRLPDFSAVMTTTYSYS